MFSIKKIAATGVMALIIGGGLIGGSMQATTASANDGSEFIKMEASGYDGIKCEDDECLRLSTVTTYQEPSPIYNNFLGITTYEPVYTWR